MRVLMFVVSVFPQNHLCSIFRRTELWMVARRSVGMETGGVWTAVGTDFLDPPTSSEWWWVLSNSNATRGQRLLCVLTVCVRDQCSGPRKRRNRLSEKEKMMIKKKERNRTICLGSLILKSNSTGSFPPCSGIQFLNVWVQVQRHKSGWDKWCVRDCVRVSVC